ncbi:MAG: phosphoenolpyruvate-utilizing N-terminal domain-containing protein [bacterium]|nr:PEP-utilizing enzyme [bacterium]MDD5858175.1 phosphoenolpyruvate-utilizing N-terminal domain-containing protein [bacterium]MDD6718789.1 phosphoenolpyruvate-utilizing N-terminal domain-containing protein [bacterium]
MRSFQGLPVSPGLVIGPVVRIDRGAVGLHRIVSDPFRERALYEAAIVLAKDELRRLQQHACGQDADILMFQIALLEDESFTNEIGDYIAAGAGSAAAVERAEQIFAGRLKNVDDAYIQERSVDVCDVCRRVVDILDGRPRRRLHLTEPSILAADLFYPSDLFGQEPGKILGIVSDSDSETSHAAIMARSMGIPALCHLGEGMADTIAGHRAILDAENGRLTLDPTPVHLEEARRRLDQLRRAGQQPDALASAPCRTRDGTAFTLLASANCSTPQSITAAIQAGVSGIGLVRTESVVVEQIDEAGQIEIYRRCLQNAGDKPVTVRTCDWGADDGGRWIYGVQEQVTDESVVMTQLSALMQAGTQGNLRVVLPMIADGEAWKTRMDQLGRCRAALRERGVPFREDVPVGCLIEIPAAALLAGEIIDGGARFLVIDVDDLTQYTCGVSRKEAGPAYRADNPAVLRLVHGVLEAAKARGVPVHLCGITKAELPALSAYLRTGVRSFCTENAYLSPLKATLMDVDLRTAPEST